MRKWPNVEIPRLRDTADARRESRLVGKQKRPRRLGQLMGITQRTLQVTFAHDKERFSPRKLIPVNPKTLGDHLLLKRIKANLSQPELAVKAGVAVRGIKAWEHDQVVPTADEWRTLAGILDLDSEYPKV